MKKKYLSAILAGILTFSAVFTTTNAATRDEIAAIKVSKSGKFNYWTKDSESKQKLVEYVKDVTNKNSKNFIPIEDRIATFDMDGTILCETAPDAIENMIFIHRTLYDKDYTASKADKAQATALETKIRNPHINTKLGSSGKFKASVFMGLDNEKYVNYVENFVQTPVEGLSNLKWCEAFYLPMIEVIKYLQSNDFKIYIVSGTERQLIRVLVCDLLNIPTNQIIGSDNEILAANQGDTNGSNYDYRADDYLIHGKLIIKNLKMNKVSAIYREIGKQPVLAFGNSSGDTSMLNYAVYGNKYKSAAFFVICDDVERELGNISKADKCKALAEENGWTSISMRDDWTTIYGDNVKKSK